MSRWFRSAAKAAPAMVGEDEEQHLRSVEGAMLKLLNDDIEEADKLLKKQDSFVSSFGKRNFRLGRYEESPKGTNGISIAHISAGYGNLLCYSVAQLTSAITAVLSGSITEAVKGFYKLRKAYLTLDGILEIENKYLETMAGSSTASLPSRPRVTKVQQWESPLINLHIKRQISRLTIFDEKLDDPNAAFPDVSRPPSPPSVTNPYDIDPELAAKRFKGTDENEERAYCGKQQDIQISTAPLLVLLYSDFTNGLVGFSDILPTDDAAEDNLVGFPRQKCEALLVDMKSRHPDSRLWKLEEARMLSYNKDLQGAIVILEDNSKSKMKQIAMINTFEMALTTLFAHEYQKAAVAWVKCSEQSAWSPTLYYYMAGVSHVELYRNARLSHPKEAAVHKKKAIELLLKAPSLAGKQKVMAKQLPFDIYIVSKVGKWEQRAKAWGVDLVDAIGPSPYVEMIYFWNGVKKSGTLELEKCLALLKDERMTCPEKCSGDEDDVAIHHLLRGCMFRNLGKYEEARKILTREIVDSERHIRGALRDDWTLPSATYELASCSWSEKDLSPAGNSAEGKISEKKVLEYQKEKILDCEEKLMKLNSWPQTYVFEARMSFKISTSLLTVRRHKALMACRMMF
ncbi:hypothetical protein DID88_001136 [Monilinia fructigena]|uniref:Inclusion body clearance protein IML2 n=1 Tax=Monilinia fructigena TaxID=38457 RepID=A0A395IYY7_9HELO|nr:hypothetical protein DID88_001136 [Monilinia fructigena]